MSIEETVYELKNKYLKPSYGVKKKIKNVNPEDVIIQSDLILQRKDGKAINTDDYVILSKEDYIARLQASEYRGKIDLLNEIFEDNPDDTCITGCNIEMK